MPIIRKKSALIYFLMLGLEFVILILVARHAGWSLNQYMIGFDTNDYLFVYRQINDNNNIYWVFNSFKPAIFLGMIVFSLSAPLIYLTMREIFSEKLAFWSGIIFALEPRMAFAAPFLLSEQIFLPFFLLAVFFTVKFFIHPDNKNYILLSALALGISAPIRLISFFLWPFMVIFFFLKLHKKQKTIEIFKVLGIATLIFISVTLSWSIRNRLVIGTWQPSAIIGTHLIGFLETLKEYQGIPEEKTFQEARSSIACEGWQEQ